MALSLKRRHDRRAATRAAVAILADKEFDLLPLPAQVKQVRDAILVLARWLRRALVGVVIIAVGVTVALWREESLQRRLADQQQRFTYDVCLAVNQGFEGVRNGFDVGLKDVPTKGVTDPATLARIVQQNAQRYAARTLIDTAIRNAEIPCGKRKP